MADDRTAIQTALTVDVAWLTHLGVITAVPDTELEALVETYDTEYSLADQIERAGESYVVAQLVFEVLQRQNVGLYHDTECIYGYESYRELLGEYTDLTDGRLDATICDIEGDWSADEPAHVTLDLDGERVQATLRYGGDWMDLDGFLSLLNRLVEAATDDPRRFAYVRADTGTTAHVVFARPSQIDALDAYFETAVEAYKRHRGE